MVVVVVEVVEEVVVLVEVVEEVVVEVVVVVEDVPTNHCSQYFFILSSSGMSQGWTKMQAPISSATCTHAHTHIHKHILVN